MDPEAAGLAETIETSAGAAAASRKELIAFDGNPRLAFEAGLRAGLAAEEAGAGSSGKLLANFWTEVSLLQDTNMPLGPIVAGLIHGLDIAHPAPDAQVEGGQAGSGEDPRVTLIRKSLKDAGFGDAEMKECKHAIDWATGKYEKDQFRALQSGIERSEGPDPTGEKLWVRNFAMISMPESQVSEPAPASPAATATPATFASPASFTTTHAGAAASASPDPRPASGLQPASATPAATPQPRLPASARPPWATHRPLQSPPTKDRQIPSPAASGVSSGAGRWTSDMQAFQKALVDAKGKPWKEFIKSPQFRGWSPQRIKGMADQFCGLASERFRAVAEAADFMSQLEKTGIPRPQTFEMPWWDPGVERATGVPAPELDKLQSIIERHIENNPPQVPNPNSFGQSVIRFFRRPAARLSWEQMIASCKNKTRNLTMNNDIGWPELSVKGASTEAKQNEEHLRFLLDYHKRCAALGIENPFSA